MARPTQIQFQQLAAFVCASWAYWSVNFDEPTCAEANRANIYGFLEQNLLSLRTEVVFLGLNKAEGDRKNQVERYHNFHSVGHAGDMTLKVYLQEYILPNLLGGFMTDLNSRQVATNSAVVNFIQNDLTVLEQQLDILAQPRFKIICFGNVSFNHLLDLLKHAYPNIQVPVPIEQAHRVLFSPVNHPLYHLDIYRVWHYSCRGNNHRNVVQLQKQLLSLN